jgi:hypothetical protein
MTSPPLHRPRVQGAGSARGREAGSRRGREADPVGLRGAVLALAAFLLLGLVAFPLSGQEGGAVTATDDFDSMFDAPIIEEPPKSSGGQGQSPEEALLVSKGVEWGGRFLTTPKAEWTWFGFPDSWGALVRPDARFLDAQVEGDLFFDARPERDFRVFGKLRALYSYDSSALTATPVQDPWQWDLRVFELFSDFQFGDRVFFRMGKHTIRWGVGYFFSPADVFNLVTIDPENPEAEREGPVSLKVQVPFGPHNAYLYVVADSDLTGPEGLAWAPKVELVLGEYELGIGAYYRPDLKLRPKGLFTLTGSIRDVDLFGEAVLQWGSDRTYIRTGLPYATYRREEELFFSGTVGVIYLNADWNLALYAQYYYNGIGYQDFPVDPAVSLLALASGDLTAADLLYRDRHYLAASATWSEILNSDFAVGLLYLANLSDGSGQLTPTVSWQPWDYFQLSLGVLWAYGQPGDELAPDGRSYGVSIGATLGNGKF